jgi:HME family heavy-metal exporter
MSHAGAILAVTWVLVVASAVALALMGKKFLPEFDEGSIQVNLTLPPGSSLQASNEVSAVADAVFARMQKTDDNPDGLLLNFVRRTGRAELDEHAHGVNVTEYILAINPGAGLHRDEAISHVRQELAAALPPMDVEVEQPLSHMISHMLSGVTAQIAIKVHGDDLNVLRRVAEQVKAAAAGVDGVTPPVIEAQEMTNELHLLMKPKQLALYGLDRAEVADFLHTALRGETATEVIDGQRRFDVLVGLDEPYRSDYASLGRLRMELPQGKGWVALRELVDVDPGLGPNEVNRENARRRIVIRCNTEGRDLAGVVGDIKERVAEQVTLPEGYSVEYGGQFESQERATWLIGILSLVAVAGMFVVLLLLYPSARVVLQILNALPAAFVGGVAALLLTGQTLTVASMVGFISLGGIAARNGILLVSHYFHLMKHEGEGFTREMVMRGSLERLAPVLMTALTAGIALAPLVWAGDEPGREILYPVATVILGGLITSTLCEFLIHPGLFWRFSGKDAVRLANVAEGEDEFTKD